MMGRYTLLTFLDPSWIGHWYIIAGAVSSFEIRTEFYSLSATFEWLSPIMAN